MILLQAFKKKFYQPIKFHSSDSLYKYIIFIPKSKYAEMECWSVG